MVHRMLSLSIVVLALGSLVACAPAATKKDETKSHEGTVVSAGSGKLVMTGKDGKEHSHNIAATVKITIDGKPAKLEDLKKDMKITVTTDKSGKVSAVSSGVAKPTGKTAAKAAVKTTTAPVAKAAAASPAKAPAAK